jgi:hypothetical protein
MKGKKSFKKCWPAGVANMVEFNKVMISLSRVQTCPAAGEKCIENKII